MRECPNNISSVACFSISFYKILNDIEKSVYKKYKLKNKSLSYILLISFHEGLNQEKIGDFLNANKSKVVRNLDYLEEEEYIVRKQDKQNRRQNKVFITDLGLEVTRYAEEIYASLMENESIRGNQSVAEFNNFLKNYSK